MPGRAGSHRRWLVAGLVAAALVAGGLSSSASAQPGRPAPKIGVVDLDRLVAESPLAGQAKQNMAKRFARRKNALEQATGALQKAIDRLDATSDTLNEDQRSARQAAIVKQKHDLEIEQSHYNDDVSAAEDKELSRMRTDLRAVIDDYAQSHGYDLIVGSSVLYADDRVDITDAILKRLKTDP